MCKNKINILGNRRVMDKNKLSFKEINTARKIKKFEKAVAINFTMS